MAQQWTIKAERIGKRDGVRAIVSAYGVTVGAWAPSACEAIELAGGIAAQRIEAGERDAAGTAPVVHVATRNPFAGGRSIVSGARAALLAKVERCRAGIEDFRRAIDADTDADGTPGETVQGCEWAIDALRAELSEAGAELARMDREGR